MNIECNLDTLAELEHTFKFNDAIIRHLVFGNKEAVTVTICYDERREV